MASGRHALRGWEATAEFDAGFSSAEEESSVGSHFLNKNEVDKAEESFFLNELDDPQPAVALLKQIFPEENSESLRQLHLDRCERRSRSAGRGASDYDRQQSTRRRERPSENRGNSSRAVNLPEDFLRLPAQVAVRRFVDGSWRYEFIQQLEQCALIQHERCFMSSTPMQSFTRVISRDNKGGLGMTIVEENGLVRVHWLAGMKVQRDDESPDANETPALCAGIRCGDVLIGIEGVAFVESVSPSESLVKHAVSRLRSAQSPVVLHLQRFQPQLQQDPRSPLPKVVSLPVSVTTPSLLDTSDIFSDGSSTLPANESIHSDLSRSDYDFGPHSESTGASSHPFIKLLTKKGVIRSEKEQLVESKLLYSFEARTDEWGGVSAFHLFTGIRKALSVRIVNTFEDGDETAYTLWVYDVESGKEWYAPVRYFRDFADLRSATVRLCPSIANLPFPKTRPALALFRSPSRKETSAQCEIKCRQLETFIRSLCALIHRTKPASITEVAIHVQSFLGCDDKDLDLHTSLQVDTMRFNDVEDSSEKVQQERFRVQLKRSLQFYTYRLFLLDSLSRVVANFVDALRTLGPRIEDIESLEAQGNDVLKSRAMKDLMRIHEFLDKVQDLILEGCVDDFESIASRPEFHSILHLIRGGKAGYWDRLVREAVREQVEIEIYVPLRSIVSRWLVYGWRHDDMEIQFKIKELRKRPQEFFRIPSQDWSAVSDILNRGVGLSTLPCVKLRAIVAAASEISRIYAARRDLDSNRKKQVAEHTTDDFHLGADDFLPIFIYCVVQAEMERPCALCVLLRTLCDRINKIGEIGYYLLTFEAAITHCQEVDLTEDREEMQSFLSIPLSDS